MATIREQSSEDRMQLMEAADARWKVYVGQLAADDPSGAFLLADELPNGLSSPEEIEHAIKTATRRAFMLAPPHRSQKSSRLPRILKVLLNFIPSWHSFRLTNYQFGRIRGQLSVLLPQGQEIRVNFNDDLGWKAKAVIGDGPERRMMTMYYRETCMNPARVLSRTGGTIDSSRVEFTPYGDHDIQRILADKEVDRFTKLHLRRLRQQYRMLAQAGMVQKA